MTNRRIKSSLVIAFLLLFPLISPLVPSPSMDAEDNLVAASTPPPPVDPGDWVLGELNYTDYYGSYEITISEIGIYLFNFTLLSDQYSDDSYVYLSLYESSERHHPSLNHTVSDQRILETYTWSYPVAGSTSNLLHEITVIEPGSLRVEVYGTSSSYGFYVMDTYYYNFTLTPLLEFSSATDMTLGSAYEDTLTTEDTWKAYHLDLPNTGLYNISLQVDLPYDVTAGWFGGSVTPIDRFWFLDSKYGKPQMMYSLIDWVPSLFVPPGPLIGTDSDSLMDFFNLEPIDHYFVIHTGDFLFLNGSHVNVTLFVEELPTQSLGAGSNVTLQFNSTNFMQYVEIDMPMGSIYDMYFDTPEGYNWTAYCMDFGFIMPTPVMVPYYDYFENTTTTIIDEARIHNATPSFYPTSLSTFIPALGFSWTGLTGEQYFPVKGAYITALRYLDDIPQPGPMPPIPSPFGVWSTITDALIIPVVAGPSIDGSTTFNITLHLEASPVPELTTSGAVVEINTTYLPYYHIFQIPIISGHLYEITANATAFTTTGFAGLWPFINEETYAHYGWLTHPQLMSIFPYDPIMMPTGVLGNYDGPITYKFMATANSTMYIIVMGIDPSGMIVSDTTEITLELTVTSPTAYTLGTAETATLNRESTVFFDFVAYQFPIVEGYDYRFTMSPEYDSAYAYALFVNDYGHSPFERSEQNLISSSAFSTLGLILYYPYPWIMYSSMQYSGILRAQETGTATLILVGGSTIHFDIEVIDEILPTVSIDDPDPGAILDPGTVTLSFTATDDFGIATLTLNINGTDIDLSPSATGFAWDVSANGIYTITLTAEDGNGNIASDTISVLIRPDPGSYDSGHTAGLTLGYIIAAAGIIGAAIICFLLGWFLKGRRK